MSIFNQPLNPKITGTLTRRQNNIGTDGVYQPRENIALINPQNSWVSLKSSVNVNNDGGKLAKDNILSGGTDSVGNLLFGKLKSGVTADSLGAYSLKNSDGSTNILGVKPMPGITSVSIDNIGAYGSLRKATINFQCWDIKQLEILEKLYMRPGYTVLLEFGRASYINEKAKIINPKDDLGFFNLSDQNLQTYLNTLHAKSINHEGNYDAFFGYITNYGWNARSDGGYDCKTEIISTGELLESLKSNYSLAGLTDYASLSINPTTAKFKGLMLPTMNLLIKPEPSQITKLNKEYSENIISGLMYELYLAIEYAPFSSPSTFIPGSGNIVSLSSSSNTRSPNIISFQIDGKKIDIDYTTQAYKSTSDIQDTNDPNKFNDNNSNVYITLRSLIKLFNTFILPKSFSRKGKNTGELVSLSVDDRSYLSKDPTNPTPPPPLLCLYNSLMLSTNPDMCWIKNDSWASIVSGVAIETNITRTDPIDFSDPDIQNGAAVRQKLIKWIDYLVTHTIDQNETILTQIESDKQANNIPNYYEILSKNYSVLRGGKSKTNPDLYSWEIYRAEGGTKDSKLNELNAELFSNVQSFGDLLQRTTRRSYSSLTAKAELKKLNPTAEAEVQRVQTQVEEAQAKQKSINEARTELVNLSNKFKTFNGSFPKDFVVGGSGSKFGNIGNIYINLKYIYKLAKDSQLLSQDPTGNNKISVSAFIKQMMQDIQSSLGNVNQFELHIDPIDSVGRIIDLSYINLDKKPDLFTFEIGSNKSIVRDLKLESQIFSDQSSIVAISAQDSAGALGSNNSTLVGFNDGITDRMILRKDSYLNSIHSREAAEETIIYNYISSLSYIVNYYLKPLLGISTTEPLPDWAKFAAAEQGSDQQTIFGGGVKDSNFNSGQSLSYSNSLRDIMYFFTSVLSFNENNKDKQFIPTLLSLTIDGLSGFIIGNLFKIDSTFVPNYYKRGNNTAYTLTKVNHELANNDWITTISGYPFNLEANNISGKKDLIEEITKKKIVVDIDPNPPGSGNSSSGAGTNSSIVNKTFNDVIKDIAIIYGVKYRSIVPVNFATLSEKFSKAMNDIFTAMAQDPILKNEILYVHSLVRGDSVNHAKGNGLDFQLDTKGSLSAVTSKTYLKWASVRNARSKKTDADKKAVWVGVYGKEQVERIQYISDFLKNKFNGVDNIGTDVSIDLNVNGIKVRFINENFYPTAPAKGPHFHFQLI